MNRIKNYKYWVIVGLLLLATSLSFLDRQVLSVSVIKIKGELHLSDIDYGLINMGFLIGYAIMFTMGGILIDRFGSRLGLALSVGFWSFATVLHSISNSVFHLGLFRFMLGIGEGGCFPGAIKAVIEWVPKKKHALANGIAIGGSAIGAVAAPPLTVYLLNLAGWRAVFIITGLFGFIWLAVWLIVTMGQKRPSMIDHEMINPDNDNRKEKLKLGELLKNRDTLVFIVMRFLLDPVFYFYMFWIPKYLNEHLALSLETIGKIFWIPFLALGLANILGGWLSDLIFIKTSNTNLARKMVMGIASLLTIPVLSVSFLNSYSIIIVVVSLAFFAHGLWITNYITAIGDIFGNRATSTVVGLSGSAGALLSLVLNPVIGYIVSNYSYNPIWWYAGLMYPLVFVFFHLMIPKITQQNRVEIRV